MLEDKLDKIEKRYKELEGLLSSAEVTANGELFRTYSKELGEIRDVVAKYSELKTVKKELAGAAEMLSDKELKELAKGEIERLEAKKVSLLKEIEVLLIPKDPYDDKNIFLEIRAGTGGEEAALFAGTLLRMYTRYAENHKWKTELMSGNATGLGGFKEVVLGIYGKGAYSKLKFESGAHRVQRVPLTEASGRIHTSAVTVAVMPEAEEVDVKVNDSDLRIDTFRSSGPGGQNVQKVSSAVRVTHIPSGLVVECQEERSQFSNKEKAMKLLRARLLEAEVDRQKGEIAQMRKIQIGTGDRSEKIRTYNFPQNRITDHRISFSVHSMDAFLDGKLDEMIDALTTADQAAKLKKIK
jgi:peptide chain release factor 1